RVVGVFVRGGGVRSVRQESGGSGGIDELGTKSRRRAAATARRSVVPITNQWSGSIMTRATRLSRRIAGAVVALVLAALPCRAQTPAPAPSPSPSPEPEPAKVDVTGFVDVYYMYNFNETDPFGRTF